MHGLQREGLHARLGCSWHLLGLQTIKAAGFADKTCEGAVRNLVYQDSMHRSTDPLQVYLSDVAKFSSNKSTRNSPEIRPGLITCRNFCMYTLFVFNQSPYTIHWQNEK